MSFGHVILHARKTFGHNRSYKVFDLFICFAMFSVMGLEEGGGVHLCMGVEMEATLRWLHIWT